MAANGRQFYRDCSISGTIDFIFGNAATLLQNCNIYVRRPSNNIIPVITAQGRITPATNTGIVMQNCTITADPTSPGLRGVAYLGRPWKKYSRVVIMESNIGQVINPLGWLYWLGDTKSLDNVYYGEYKNTGPSSSTTTRTKCLGCKTIVGPDEALNFSFRKFLDGISWIPNIGIPYSSDL
ncbi:hypothetical protein vseg_002604 [Gypsophila vaccaria]